MSGIVTACVYVYNLGNGSCSVIPCRLASAKQTSQLARPDLHGTCQAADTAFLAERDGHKVLRPSQSFTIQLSSTTCCQQGVHLCPPCTTYVTITCTSTWSRSCKTKLASSASPGGLSPFALLQLLLLLILRLGLLVLVLVPRELSCDSQ